MLLFSASCLQAASDTPPMPTGSLTKAAALPTPAAAPLFIASPVTVTGITVDKTDKNSVVARDAAITEAQRIAFQKICEKWMAPETRKTFQIPSDKIIATLVRDLEIKDEQIATNRYMATFTVRFNPGISNYVNIPVGSTTTIAADEMPSTPEALPKLETRDVLVLPYYEDISGKKLLWEDPNPWRETWQAMGNSAPGPGLSILVPTGDLTDISFGSTDAVWAGDYSEVEKLRKNYNATEVALTVANKSGAFMRVSLYIFKNGKLERKKSVIPYAYAEVQDDPDFFKKMVNDVIGAIKSPQPYVDGGEISPVEPLPAGQEDFQKEMARPTSLIMKPTQAALPEKIVLDTSMSFDSFTQWLEVQRRLTSISPTPVIAISSLTKNSARFTVSYDGGVEKFKNALAEKGLALNQPIVEVDEALTGKPSQRPVYEIQLTN